MSLALRCMVRLCVGGGGGGGGGRAAAMLQTALPAHVSPVGGSVQLQLYVTALYEELHKWAHRDQARERAGELLVL